MEHDTIELRFEKGIQLRFQNETFPLFCSRGALDRLPSYLQALGADRLFIIADETVLKRYGNDIFKNLNGLFPVTILPHQSGERAKSLSIVSEMLDQIVISGATRSSVVLSLGGGVTGNIAGVVAGLLFRGVRLIHLPSTLMAALDSVISLKQAVNSSSGKNHFGLYLAPEAVFADLTLFDSLPEREIKSGIAELIKNSLAIDPATIEPLKNILNHCAHRSDATLLELISLGIEVKQKILVHDRKEGSRGILLEYGHTIGHAIEHVFEGSCSHGQCVAWGMLAAARVSSNIGGLPSSGIAVHRELIQMAQLDETISTKQGIIEDVMKRIICDNKRGYMATRDDEVPMVLLKDIGDPMISNGLPIFPVALRVVRNAVESLF